VARATDSLLNFALRLPDTTEGIACAGTAIESRTAQTRGKAFLFVGAGVVRFKLDASTKEMAQLAAKDPAHFEVGFAGWCKITIGGGKLPPAAQLRRWITESHSLFAGKAVGATKPAAAKKKPAPAKRKTGGRQA